MEMIIGIIAGTLTSISMLPQLVKVLKEKKSDNLSISMLVVLLMGVSLWVIFGFMKNEWPIIISNLFSVCVNSILLISCFVFKKDNS